MNPCQRTGCNFQKLIKTGDKNGSFDRLVWPLDWSIASVFILPTMVFKILIVALSVIAVPFLVSTAPQRSDAENTRDIWNQAVPRRSDLKPIADVIFAMLDTWGMGSYITEKLQTEPAAQAVLNYLRGADGKTINNAFWNDSEFEQFIFWLRTNGLFNIYDDINLLHAFLGWELVHPPSASSAANNEIIAIESKIVPSARNQDRSTPLKGLLEEFFELFGYDFYRVAKYYVGLLTEGDESAIALYQRMKQSEMRNSWRNFKLVPEVQNMFKILRNEGIDIDRIILTIELIFGW